MDSQASSQWWMQLNPPWTFSDAEHLTDLLIHAYSTQISIEPFAAIAGYIPKQPVNPTVTAEDWRNVFRQASDHHTLDHLLEQLQGNPSTSESILKLHNFLESRLSQHNGLQTSLGSGRAVESNTFLNIHNELRIRLAHIRINGHESGTGVLIGGNLLLTTGHVIEKPTGHITLPQSIEAEFDFFQRSDNDYTEIGPAIRSSRIICYSPPAETERRGEVSQFDEISENQIDYAIVELAANPPKAFLNNKRRPRGHYQLHFAPYEFQPNEILTVGHLPNRGPASYSYVTSVRADANGRRIKYTADTSHGSSGGPIVNSNGQLIALHNYGGKSFNQGIPIHAIAQDIENKGLKYLFDSDNVSYAGRYSLTARDQICRALSREWQEFISYIALPESIDDPYDAWDWLASHRRLGKLRGALKEAGHASLVEILDRDVIVVNPDIINQIQELSASLTESARKSEIPSSHAPEIVVMRHLSRKMLDRVNILLETECDKRTRLLWRMEWQQNLRNIESRLSSFLGILPSEHGHPIPHQSIRQEIFRRASHIDSAASALYQLARNPSLHT